MKNVYRGLLSRKITQRQIDAARRHRHSEFGLLNECRFMEEWQEKVLLLLCLNYKIDLNAPDRWKKLAFNLAEVHVPAFNVAELPGAKKHYGDEFVRDVEEIKQRLDLNSDKRAFIALQKEGKYPGELLTLARRLRKSKADKRLSAQQEEAILKSREAFVRDAMRAAEFPVREAINQKKRRK